jgi:hypothetical protein
MSKYLDILAGRGLRHKRHKRQKSPAAGRANTLCRINRFCRTFSTLQSRCPTHIPVARWQTAIEDGRRFLARWGEQAKALGWTARDLFGLHKPPEKPHPSYSRLSRYDEAGLIWLLCGREVVALTEGDGRDPESDGRDHGLPQAQQAGVRPGRRQPGRPAMTHKRTSE